jgi:hypothetical protein
MGNNTFNPYWGKAIQYQQKAQPKPETKQTGKQPSKARGDRPRDFGGFDSLIVGRECIIKLGCGEAIKGTISATSKYWYMMNVDGQIIIVNKAYVVSITPVQPQNKNNAAGTLVDASVAPYGEKKK